MRISGGGRDDDAAISTRSRGGNTFGIGAETGRLGTTAESARTPLSTDGSRGAPTRGMGAATELVGNTRPSNVRTRSSSDFGITGSAARGILLGCCGLRRRLALPRALNGGALARRLHRRHRRGYRCCRQHLTVKRHPAWLRARGVSCRHPGLYRDGCGCGRGVACWLCCPLPCPVCAAGLGGCTGGIGAVTCEVGKTRPFSTVPGRTIFCTGSGILTPEIDAYV